MMGDHEAADVVSDFCCTARFLLREHGGEEVKTIGDAVMLRTEAAPPAVLIGLELVDMVRSRHGFPAVRVGMHTGQAVERDGDWFGAAVNVAARISGLAGAGEVLLTEATRAEAGEPEGAVFHERGRHELKNVSEPVVVFAARRAGPETGAGLPIDPVCRMAVDPVRAVGSLIHEGVEYRFCSLVCVRAFATDPDRFARGG